MELGQWLSKAEGIDFGEIINAAIKKHEDVIIRLNTDSQLFGSGIKHTGARITPPYAASTVRYKKRRGQPSDRVTLRDTGQFHNAFKIIYESDQITIVPDAVILDGSFDLSEHLQKRYGATIAGLTTLNIDELRALIIPEIIKMTREAVQ